MSCMREVSRLSEATSSSIKLFQSLLAGTLCSGPGSDPRLALLRNASILIPYLLLCLSVQIWYLSRSPQRTSPSERPPVGSSLIANVLAHNNCPWEGRGLSRPGTGILHRQPKKLSWIWSGPGDSRLLRRVNSWAKRARPRRIIQVSGVVGVLSGLEFGGAHRGGG